MGHRTPHLLFPWPTKAEPLAILTLIFRQHYQQLIYNLSEYSKLCHSETRNLIASIARTMAVSPFLAPHQGKNNKYTQAFLNQNGPGDARPTAMQIVEDNGCIGTMKDKVRLSLPLTAKPFFPSLLNGS